MSSDIQFVLLALLLALLGLMLAALRNLTAKIDKATAVTQGQSEIEAQGLKHIKELDDQRIKFQESALEQSKINADIVDRLHRIELDAEKKRSADAAIISDLKNQVLIVGENRATAQESLNAVRQELAIAQKSEAETREALMKANAINQDYQRTIQDQGRTIEEQKTTTGELRAQLREAEARISKLEAELGRLKADEAERHERDNRLTADNLALTIDLAEHRLALSSILTAIPLRAMPPEVVKLFSEKGLDVYKLAGLKVDGEALLAPSQVLQEAAARASDLSVAPG